MNVPAITLVDEIALQKAIALILCSDSRLVNVPVVPEIKFLQESELALNAIWTMPRSAFTVTATGWQVNATAYANLITPGTYDGTGSFTQNGLTIGNPYSFIFGENDLSFNDGITDHLSVGGTVYFVATSASIVLTGTPDLAVTATLQTNALVGGGILVEQPEMDSNSPGVSGPAATWKVPIVGFVEPNTAFVPNVGIGFTSSQLCQIALDILQNLFSYQYGTFQIEQQAIKAANDRQTESPGIAAHRVVVKATIGRVQSVRSVSVTAIFGGGNCTLTCADGTASILYTTDLSEPVTANPNAIAYAGPFAVASGAVIKFASHKAGTIVSQIVGAQSP